MRPGLLQALHNHLVISHRRRAPGHVQRGGSIVPPRQRLPDPITYGTRGIHLQVEGAGSGQIGRRAALMVYGPTYPQSGESRTGAETRLAQ